MPHFINSTKLIVKEALAGMAEAHSDKITVNLDKQLVFRREPKNLGKVALVSGGGSGHEPMHAGFVGEGMLDAACVGDIFTSPTADQVLKAVEEVDQGAGVLYLVKNYSGDLMNFEVAAELASTELRFVVINDDVSVQELDEKISDNARGIAGTVLVEKIVGALAENGGDILSCVSLAQTVVENTRSMGVALSACNVPTSDRESFSLKRGFMELGVGIHGEYGVRQVPVESALGVSSLLLDPIITDMNLREGDDIILMCNGLGGTPLLELYVILNSALEVLNKHGINVKRNLVGSYCTALDMKGVSLSVMKVTDGILKLWDAPVKTPNFNWG